MKKYEGKQKDILKEIESYDHLKVLVNTTGVYIALYDSKKKEVSKEDDENGHIDQSNSNDHDFLNGKFIETNKGVTYDLIDPLLMQRLSLLGNNDNNPNNDNNTNNDNKGVVNEKKSDDINEE